MSKKVMVFGSFVVDLMGRAPHLPVPGETVKGSVFKMGPGGKGFNQGVAAHKAGARVRMVTKLGRDAFADIALNTMKELGMDTGAMMITEERETGAALIMVDERSSQNKIVVIPGACETITDAEVDALEGHMEESEFLLTQLETNISSVERILDLACRNNVKVILNTAPVQPVSEEVLSKTYLITPNEVEAEILSGIEIRDEAAADRAAEYFFAKGVKNVLITLGERGVYINSEGKKGIIPAYRVKAVDTTGAGDAFNGGLVAALAEGKSIWDAAVFANALAALSVQKIGTTPAMPWREEVDRFMKEEEHA